MAATLPAKQDKKKRVKEYVEQGTGKIPQKGGYYQTPGGDFEADAWRAQEEANKEKITTEIVSAVQTDSYVQVIARAYHPEGWHVDGVVNHNYDTIMGKKLMEMYKKELIGEAITFGAKKHKKRIQVFEDLDNAFSVGENGKLIPHLAGEGVAKILDDMLRFRDISIRDAASKAMRIAQLKALNKEWREEEEIKAEEEEVKSINKGANVKKVNQETVDEAEKKKKQEAKKPVPPKTQGKTVSKEERQKAIDEVMKNRKTDKETEDKNKEEKKEKKKKDNKQEGKEKSKSVKKTGSTKQKEKVTQPKKPKEKIPEGIDPKKVQEGEVTQKKKKENKNKDENLTEDGQSRWTGLNGKQIVDLVRKTNKPTKGELTPNQVKMEIYNLQKGKLINKGQYIDAKNFLSDITEK